MITTNRILDRLRLLLLSLLLLLTFPISSHAAQSSANTSDRPKIGVAFSGGGARGAAHVGVIKVLEEMKVPIDYIAGTSMGAIIGGLYASGMTPQEIEKVLDEMDWDAVFEDEASRPDRSNRRKQEDRLYLAQIKPGVKDGEVRIPTAVIQGQKFDMELSRLTEHVWNVKDFDNLPIPFRAVATDITTGQAVVLGEGNLAKSIRASMSVPAAFAAVEIDGKMLVDGGVSNNLPISVVRDMGADIVIAIDISTPLKSKDELGSALDVLGQLSSFLTVKNANAQKATLTDKDILVVPALGDDLSSADFDKVLEAVEIGQKAGEEKRGDFARLSISNDNYAEHIAQRKIEERQPAIDFIRFENDSDLSDEVVAHTLDIQAGDPLDIEQLEKGIQRVYGLDVFSSVSYEFVEEEGKDGVVIHTEEKPWGTDYIQFGMELSADTNAGDSAFNIGAAYTHMPLNERNGEWKTAVQFGEEPSIATEIYQPLDVDSDYVAYGLAGFITQNFRVFDGDDALAEYEAEYWNLDVALARNFQTWGELRGGYRYLNGSVDIISGQDLGDFNFEIGEAYLRFTIDQLNSVHFPTAGLGLTFEGVVSHEDIGSDYDYEQLMLVAAGAKTYGKNTILSYFRFDTTLDDDAPFERYFRIGGFQQLSGFQQNQLSGQHVGLAAVAYRRLIYPNKFVPVYLTATAEIGNAWQDTDDIGIDDSILAGSLSIGVDTLLGPVYFGYGHAEGGNNAVFLYVGSPWL